MNRFRLAVLVALTGAPALASSPDPKDLAIPPHELARARELVRGLGSDVYREREEAEELLAKMGRLARPVLSDAVAQDPDPEVRGRAGRLLAKATADDLRARIDTFLADADGKFEHSLPGWNQLRKVAGADKPARELFVELIKTPAHLDLFAALDKSSEEAGQAVADRRAALYGLINQRFQAGVAAPRPAGGQPARPAITIPEIAALLLAETFVPAEHIPRAGQLRYVNGVTFFQQPNSLAALNTPGVPHGETYKRVVAAWLETRVDPSDLSNLVHVAGNQLKGMKETPALLRRIADTNGVTGWARGQAISFLVQANGEKEVPRLKALLADETLLTQVWLGNNLAAANGSPLLMRDVALAHLLTMNKLELKDYGFELPHGLPAGIKATAFGSYAFTTPEARDAAFKKWAAREKEQAGKPEKK